MKKASTKEKKSSSKTENLTVVNETVKIEEESKDLPIIKDEIEEELEDTCTESVKSISDEEHDKETLNSIETIITLCGKLKKLKNFNFNNESNVQIFKKQIKVLPKDFGEVMSKINELCSTELTKQLKSNKNNKKNKKEKDPNKDTSKSAVNIKRDVESEILQLMKLPDDTQLSSSDILRYANGLVKDYKNKDGEKYDPNIFTDDKNNRKFRIIKDLKKFYDFIAIKMNNLKIKKGDDVFKLEDFPKELSYQQIMTYNKYCFK